MFRGMDNNFIRQMMKSTRGVDLTDEQILMMKAQTTPENMKYAIKQNTNLNSNSSNSNIVNST